MTVGASTDDGVTALVAELNQTGADPKQIEMRLLEGSVALPTPAIDMEYIPCGLGAKAEDFPAEVAGRIALIQRGEITFREKAQNAQGAGAIAAVIYNNRDGNFFGSMGDEADRPNIPAVSISKADGDLMIQVRGQGGEEAAKLRLTPEEVPQPDRLAEFSSRGPNNDGWIKPEITAPGVNIYSATITEAGMPGGGMPDPSGYISASGTSMATPHVAGAVALLRQAHPDWTSMQMKAALVNTARWMKSQGTVMDQGNGAMDLNRALDCRAILVAATDPVAPTHSFGQVVHDGKAVTVSQAFTILPLDPEAAKFTYNLSVELNGAPTGLTAELSAGTVSCTAEGCNAAFELRLTADGATVQDGGYYGFITAQAEWGQLRLPFYYEAARQPSVTPPGSGSKNPIPGIPPQKRPGGMPAR
ncbi:MAG TPA: S8 family serine peptidase [Symbiobacteriaceae bacterium]|nr:S8 family serine peptidase [Symbiobacteriaceae bacterium]